MPVRLGKVCPQYCPPEEQKIPILFVSGNLRFSSNNGTKESLVAEEAGWKIVKKHSASTSHLCFP
ncbi:MAG: hypothetical protein IJ727_02535 [Treponema sp.]|nr:hypothetical protein [Treponema sp.]